MTMENKNDLPIEAGNQDDGGLLLRVVCGKGERRCGKQQHKGKADDG